MPKKEKYKIKKETDAVNEPEINFISKNRISFSTLETQGDIQLEYTLSLSPLQRFELMNKLNSIVFEELTHKALKKNGRIVFSRYEYTPG